MKNPFTKLATFFGLGSQRKGKVRPDEKPITTLIPKNEAPAKLKAEKMPELMKAIRRANELERQRMAKERFMNRQGVNTYYFHKPTGEMVSFLARNEHNALRKFNNLVNA